MKIGGSIKERQKEKQKTKVRGGGWERKSSGSNFIFYCNKMGEIQPFKGSKSGHISITQAHIFPCLPRRFHPCSVTSGWGEKPSRERNKARNGGITGSLSEWLNRPKLKAHTLSGEGLNLVHDLYHPELHGHLGLIGFGTRKKKVKSIPKYIVRSESISRSIVVCGRGQILQMNH